MSEVTAPANRPETDDFWLLSRLVIDHDKRSEAGGGIEDIINRIVDGNSVAYMSFQRVLRTDNGPNLTHEEWVHRATAWIDGFLLGAAYQAAKDRGETR